jgi:hypothetical protein
MAVKLTSLRSEVLGCLVYNGKSSKSMIERILVKHVHITKTNRPVKHHRKEILAAFEFLRCNGLINKIDSNPGPGLVHRGRPKIYYKITNEGLKLLIMEDPHPLKFWKAVLGFCHHNDKKINLGIINEICQLFLNKYLKFPGRGFSFQLDIFDNMRDKWLNELILNGTKIALYQKVIEVLAIYPELTLKEIAEKTKENESEIREVISTYTTESYMPLTDDTYYLHQDIIGKKYNKKYWDLLLHSIVITNQSKKGIETYKLSLFGVILCLTLIRYNDMDKLKHGLYYKDILFPDYYDKIASNYKDKLPLIFGKWNLLRDILRLYSAYNFDIILDKEVRLRDSDKLSIIRGGNKELHDGNREIVLQTQRQLEYFAAMGLSIWSNYIEGVQNEYEEPERQDYDYLMNSNVNTQGKPNPQKVYDLNKKLDEIILLLHPLEKGFSKSTGLEPEVKREILHQLEKQFSDEITALYYFHLYFEYEFNTRVGQPKRYYSSIDDDENQFPISSKPKSCLSSTLQNDKKEPLLSKWFYQWMHDISSLQKEVYEALKVWE